MKTQNGLHLLLNTLFYYCYSGSEVLRLQQQTTLAIVVPIDYLDYVQVSRR